MSQRSLSGVLTLYVGSAVKYMWSPYIIKYNLLVRTFPYSFNPWRPLNTYNRLRWRSRLDFLQIKEYYKQGNFSTEAACINLCMLVHPKLR